MPVATRAMSHVSPVEGRNSKTADKSGPSHTLPLPTPVSHACPVCPMLCRTEPTPLPNILGPANEQRTPRPWPKSPTAAIAPRRPRRRARRCDRPTACSADTRRRTPPTHFSSVHTSPPAASMLAAECSAVEAVGADDAHSLRTPTPTAPETACLVCPPPRPTANGQRPPTVMHAAIIALFTTWTVDGWVCFDMAAAGCPCVPRTSSAPPPLP